MLVSKFLNSGLKILALLGLVLFSFFLQAQDLDQEISLKLKNSPISDFLDEVSKLGKINFSYSPQVIHADVVVSIKARNRKIRDILDDVLKENDIDYKIIENQVVLTCNKNLGLTGTGDSLQLTKRQKCSLYGFVKDKANGEVLIGAVVFVKGLNIGTTTNSYGFYSLSLPSGKYSLQISFLGYQYKNENIYLRKNEKRYFELEAQKVELEEVNVMPENGPGMISGQLSDMKLTTTVLRQLPGFAGDVDIIKSIEVIPGINAYGDGSSLFYVRGGNSDQNLLLVDDAPVYNPSHLFGFFTVLAPEAVKDVLIYKGGFPSNYGGRLSSVIDIKMKDGNMKDYGLSGNIGPYTSSLTIEGPVLKDKCSFFISARRSNMEWLKMTNIFSNSLSLVFYDINAKLNYRINENNRFFLSFYNGNDNFSRATSANDSYGITWTNLLGTLRWNHIFNNRLFSNSTLYSSKYNYYLYISKGLNDYWSSSISNISFKTDFTYFLNSHNTIKGGVEASLHDFNPGNVHFSDVYIQSHAPGISRYHSREFDFYLNDEFELARKLSLRLGARLPVWQDYGITTIFKYNNDHDVIDTVLFGKKNVFTTFARIEPRIDLRYAINGNSSVRASYDKTSQFLQLLTNSTSPFTSLEVWVPSGPNIKPQEADQYALGYFYWLPKPKLDFSAETFYKKFNNAIDYKDHANMLYNPLIEGELRFGTAWSYGAEIMVRKSTGKFTGWIGYTYSRSFKKIDGVNSGKTFSAFYDRPHNLCINFSCNPFKQWSFSSNWFLISGAKITTPVGFYYYNGYSVPIYGEKNNDRLPLYHRLDLAVTYKFKNHGKRLNHSLTFTLYNAYNQENLMSVNFNKKVSDNNQFVIPSDLQNGMELVPTTISVIGMVPSLTYLFKF